MEVGWVRDLVNRVLVSMILVTIRTSSLIANDSFPVLLPIH